VRRDGCCACRHDLAQRLFFANQGAFRTGDYKEIMNKVSALALLANAIRWYLFGLKGNQPHLHGLACEHRHYDLGKPLARTAEKYRGHTIVRELYARDVADDRPPTCAPPRQSARAEAGEAHPLQRLHRTRGRASLSQRAIPMSQTIRGYAGAAQRTPIVTRSA